jgi:hypothetical protein
MKYKNKMLLGKFIYITKQETIFIKQLVLLNIVIRVAQSV